MPRGFAAVRAAAQDIEERKNSGGGGRRWFSLKEGESATVRFLEQGDDVMSAWVHRLPPAAGKSFGITVPCRDQDPETGVRVGEPCPGCEQGLKRVYQGAINLIWRDAPKFQRDNEGKYVKDSKGDLIVQGTEDVVAIWRSGINVFDELSGKDATYKGLSSRDFTVTRKGTGLNTRYTVEPADPDGGPQPMSPADEELSKEKYDLNEILAPPSYESWGKTSSTGGQSQQSQASAPADTSPFMRRRG